MQGDVAKAGRTLGISDPMMRKIMRQWRNRGPAYGAMLDLVREGQASGSIRSRIDPALLSAEEIAWLNAYHARVRKELSPQLKGGALKWLKSATAAL